MELIVQIEHIVVTVAAFMASFGGLGAWVWNASARAKVWRREVELRFEAGENRFAEHAAEDEDQRQQLRKLSEDIREVRESVIAIKTLLDHVVPKAAIRATKAE